MEKIVECVPNISEGRDRRKIDIIAAAAGSAEGVKILDIDPGADTNRTVITFAGPPAAVLEGAFRLFKAAVENIDMQTHTGAHPRMGAVDVCPFVPVSGITMEECAELARSLGGRVWKELGVPVYLYEAAAASPGRKSLAAIRKGEYEGLKQKMEQLEWLPDFGTKAFNPRFGAAVIGARPFLIAYNVNLKTPEKKIAHEIAQAIRESGRPKRDASGAVVKDDAGNTIVEPGRFKKCAAVGWFIESYGCAQVSINLTDFHVTGMHDVYDACVEEATRLGVEVSGSELVGLVPRQAILASGRHYLEKRRGFPAASDSELIATAIKSLGLSDLAPFIPGERIIEEKLRGKDPLLDLTISQFIDEVGSSSVAPGGGSVAALAGSLSAALASMVAALTYGNPKLEQHHETAANAGQKLKQIREETARAIEDDTAAFKKVIAAYREKKSLPLEEAGRRIESAYQAAVEVPLQVARSMIRLLELAVEIAPIVQRSAISDLAVAVHMALAGLHGAAWNVKINLAELKESSVVSKISGELGGLISTSDKLSAKALEIAAGRLKG